MSWAITDEEWEANKAACLAVQKWNCVSAGLSTAERCPDCGFVKLVGMECAPCLMAKTAAVPEPQKASASQVGGDHYSKLAHQPWDILQERLGPEGFKAYLLGTVVAYLIREKNGLEDLQKARHTLDRLIELETDGRR